MFDSCDRRLIEARQEMLRQNACRHRTIRPTRPDQGSLPRAVDNLSVWVGGVFIQIGHRLQRTGTQGHPAAVGTGQQWSSAR